MISGGGFIHSWCHLYKSESPSQVAIFLIGFFCLLLKDIPEHVRRNKKFFLSYDNVCNLSNMKLWREPLPIKTFANLWQDNLIKIIDSIHLHNHKRESCHKNFNPKILKEKLPDGNTMICEQTFCVAVLPSAGVPGEWGCFGVLPKPPSVAQHSHFGPLAPGIVSSRAQNPQGHLGPGGAN